MQCAILSFQFFSNDFLVICSNFKYDVNIAFIPNDEKQQLSTCVPTPNQLKRRNGTVILDWELILFESCEADLWEGLNSGFLHKLFVKSNNGNKALYGRNHRTDYFLEEKNPATSFDCRFFILTYEWWSNGMCQWCISECKTIQIGAILYMWVFLRNICIVKVHQKH